MDMWGHTLTGGKQRPFSPAHPQKQPCMAKALTPKAGSEAAEAFMSVVCPTVYAPTRTLPEGAAAVLAVAWQRRELDGTYETL